MDHNGSGRSHSIPLSNEDLRSLKMADVRSLLLVLELHDKFNFSNDTMGAVFMRRNLICITGYIEQTVPKHTLRNTAM